MKPDKNFIPVIIFIEVIILKAVLCYLLKRNGQ